MGQGLAAAVLFSEGATPEDMLGDMKDAAEHAKTLEVTTASRSTTIDGLEVREGDFIGLVNDQLETAQSTPEACLLAMLEAHAEDFEIGALFYNAGFGEDAAEALRSEMEERWPDLEIELHAGGPDLYPLVMALE
jgi:uncharacterized protein